MNALNQKVLKSIRANNGMVIDGHGQARGKKKIDIVVVLKDHSGNEVLCAGYKNGLCCLNKLVPTGRGPMLSSFSAGGILILGESKEQYKQAKADYNRGRTATNVITRIIEL